MHIHIYSQSLFLKKRLLLFINLLCVCMCRHELCEDMCVYVWACGCVLCECMCVYIHAAAHSGQKKTTNSLELELPYTGAGKLNSDPVEEKQVPINTEPSVRPLKAS